MSFYFSIKLRCPGPVTHLERCVGQAGKRVEVVRRDRERLVVARERVLEAVEVALCVGAFGQSLGFFRIDRERPVLARQRVLEAL